MEDYHKWDHEGRQYHPTKGIKMDEKKCPHAVVVECSYVGNGSRQRGFCNECMSWVWCEDDYSAWLLLGEHSTNKEEE